MEHPFSLSWYCVAYHPIGKDSQMEVRLDSLICLMIDRTDVQVTLQRFKYGLHPADDIIIRPDLCIFRRNSPEYVGSADLFSSADGKNRSFLSHPTLISNNPGIFRDYSDDFHHFNKGIKKFPEELHYIFHEVARANP
jgi:hypothetical protein